MKTIIKKSPILYEHFNGIVERKDLEKSPIHEKTFTIVYIPNGKIGHFVCYFNFSYPYFFDSFGHSPKYYKLPNGICHNTMQIQNKSSCLCGAYIVFIIHHCIKYKVDPKKFIERTFDSKNLTKNDNLVFSFVNQLGIKNKSILKCQ